MAHEPLLSSIERFLSDTGMGASYFGARSVGNSKVVPRLRAGRQIHVETADRIRAFMVVEMGKRKAAERLLKRSQGHSNPSPAPADFTDFVSPAGA